MPTNSIVPDIESAQSNSGEDILNSGNRKSEGTPYFDKAKFDEYTNNPAFSEALDSEKELGRYSDDVVFSQWVGFLMKKMNKEDPFKVFPSERIHNDDSVVTTPYTCLPLPKSYVGPDSDLEGPSLLIIADDIDENPKYSTYSKAFLLTLPNDFSQNFLNDWLVVNIGDKIVPLLDGEKREVNFNDVFNAGDLLQLHSDGVELPEHVFVREISHFNGHPERMRYLGLAVDYNLKVPEGLKLQRAYIDNNIRASREEMFNDHRLEDLEKDFMKFIREGE